MKKEIIRNTLYRWIINLITTINIILIGISIAIWIASAQNKVFSTADFTNFYTGASMVTHGESNHLYDLALQTRYQQNILGGNAFKNDLLPFVNPPFFALLLSPMSLMPLNIAFYFWSSVQLLFLIWVISVLNRHFKQWTRQERLIMNITILAFWPLALTFLLGQLSILLLLCTVQVYLALQSSRFKRAAVWLSLLLIKPQGFLLPFIMTINKRYWRVFTSTVLVILSVIIVSSVFLGFNTWIQYIQILPAMGNLFGKYGFYPEAQYTFRGLLTGLLGYSQGDLINWLSIIAVFVCMVIVWFLWRQEVQEDSSKFKLYFSLTLLSSIIFSMHTFPHDDLLLVLPSVIFYDFLRQNNYPKKIYTLFMLSFPAIFIISAFSSFKIFGIIRLPIFTLFILLGWMAYYLHQERKIISPQIDKKPVIS